MNYVDCCLMAVPRAHKEKYLQHAAKMAGLFREWGALECVECWGDEIPPGKQTSLPMAVQATSDEDIVLSWMVWPSKEVRDAAHQKMRADPRMQEMGPDADLFDMGRMIFGGFEQALSSR